MNAEQREVFRDLVLRAFKNARGCGLSLVTLETTLKNCGFNRVEAEEMEAEVRYFMDKGFVAEVVKSHSVGNRIWRITASGVDDLERRGL
jgi:hypothetical protein